MSDRWKKKMNDVHTLFEETIGVLKDNNKSFSDVKWIGGKKYIIPIKDFYILSQEHYNKSSGNQKVRPDLMIVGEDFWLERHEYDGYEWWEFKTMPTYPKNPKEENEILKFFWWRDDESGDYE